MTTFRNGTVVIPRSWWMDFCWGPYWAKGGRVIKQVGGKVLLRSVSFPAAEQWVRTSKLMPYWKGAR